MKRLFGTPLKDYAPALALLVITLVYLVTAYTYQPQARAFPVAVAWVMLVLVALDIASRTKTPVGEKLIRWFNPAAAPDKLEKQPHYPLAKQFAAVAWMGGFVALMVLIGILFAVPVYVFASMYIRGKRPLWLCALVAASVTLVIYGIFNWLLQLQLYPGILFEAYV